MTKICAASSFVCAEPIVSGVSSDIGLSPRQHIITLQSHKSISKINYFRTVSTSTSQVKTRYVFPACHSVFWLPENNRPSVKTDLLGVNDIFEKTEGVLITSVAGAPPENAGKVVA